ncbi:hypothetical protein [Streptomyces anulatus]|uniref:hypothetical protein n=1 Tax=Streptomyces anulatus TaxID=1892 RepID=UPI003817B8BE|nr:hypothetical protein OHB50_09225 [Streptomyces anulatus]
MPGQAKVWVWLTAALSAAGVVTLVLVAVLADLDTADRLASIGGATLAALGLVIAVVQLVRAGGDVPVTGARSVQSGSGIGRAITGDHNRIHGPAPAAQAAPAASTPSNSHPAPGERGVSAAGPVGEAVTGDGNTQQ